MCGIAGYITGDPRQLMTPVDVMTATLDHRGPDQRGTFSVSGLALGAVRLRIVGGPSADQPVRSPGAAGRLVVNGEIYNWRRLAGDLGITTDSDSVVALEALERRGSSALGAFIGGFALAFAPVGHDRLLLARDGFGQKPLFYVDNGRQVLFASEIRALLAAGVEARLDEAGLDDYLTLQLQAPERTLFAGIQAVAPGTWIEWRRVAGRLVRSGGPIEAPPAEAAGMADIFADAARLQGERRQPAAIALSGGLDSSAVLGALVAAGTPPERAVVGAFAGDTRHDERPWARLAASAFGVPLDEVVIDARDFEAAWGRTIEALEMPVAGPGAVPQFILAAHAASFARILYGGTAGDELFGGYERLRLLQRLEDGEALDAPSVYAPLMACMGSAGGARLAYFAAIDRRGGMAPWLDRRLPTLDDVVARWQPWWSERPRVADSAALFEWRVILPALLHVDDRTTSRHAVEGRSPFLDQRLVAAVLAVPQASKSPPADPRRLFRDVMARFLPPPIRARRDKLGFPVPLASWLHGPMRDFVHDVLEGRSFRERGVLRRGAVEALLADDGARGRALFGLVSLELWFRSFLDGRVVDRQVGSNELPIRTIAAEGAS